MPSSISPMLCTLIKEPFNHEEWLYEVKWDGYRIIAFIKNGKAILKSRGDQNYTNKYPPVANAFNALDYNAVIDGEAIVLNDQGQPDFSASFALHNHSNVKLYITVEKVISLARWEDKPVCLDTELFIIL